MTKFTFRYQIILIRRQEKLKLYIDLSYQLVLTYGGRTYTLKTLRTGCLYIPKGIQLLEAFLLSAPHRCLDHTTHIQEIKDDVVNNRRISLSQGATGMETGGDDEILYYKDGKIWKLRINGPPKLLPFPKAKLLEILEALEEELNRIED